MLLQLLRQRAWRLWRKSVDLYQISRSPWRVIAYNAKFIFRKIPFLIEHARQLRNIDRVVKDAGIDAGLDSTIRIAIKITGGGLGDFLVVARFARDLVAGCGNIQFDVYSGEIETCRWVFRNAPGFRNCYSQFAFARMSGLYALSFEADHCPLLVGDIIEPGVLSRNKELARVVDALRRFQREHEPIIARRPYLYTYLAQEAVYSNHNRSNYLHGIAGITHGGDRYDVAKDDGALARFGLEDMAYITLHNGFSPAFVITSKQATKCYPHFDAVVWQLKQRFLDLRIIQVGASNSIPIRGCDLDLRSKTTLPELAGVLSRSILHVDNESGLVHLAACLGVTSCVVFGPTPVDYFGYSENLNIRPRFCGGCWEINETWMDQCPRGFATAKCMSDQPPELVAEHIEQFLEQRPAVASDSLAAP